MRQHSKLEAVGAAQRVEERMAMATNITMIILGTPLDLMMKGANPQRSTKEAVVVGVVTEKTAVTGRITRCLLRNSVRVARIVKVIIAKAQPHLAKTPTNRIRKVDAVRKTQEEVRGRRKAERMSHHPQDVPKTILEEVTRTQVRGATARPRRQVAIARPRTSTHPQGNEVVGVGMAAIPCHHPQEIIMVEVIVTAADAAIMEKVATTGIITKIIAIEKTVSEETSEDSSFYQSATLIYFRTEIQYQVLNSNH